MIGELNSMPCDSAEGSRMCEKRLENIQLQNSSQYGSQTRGDRWTSRYAPSYEQTTNIVELHIEYGIMPEYCPAD